mgnify:CR=1 FL=1
MQKTGLFILCMLIFASCSNEKDFDMETYKKEMQDWKTKRLANLKAEDGWLNLAGLLWLKEGKNSFGSHSDNDIIFPEGAPEHIGTIFLKDGQIITVIHEGPEVYHADSLVHRIEMVSDAEGSPTNLTCHPFRWFIIKRGDRYAIRLRNLESSLIDKIDSIPAFPVQEEWRIKGKFDAFASPKKMEIPNVLGETEVAGVHGKLLFEKDGKQFELLPMGTPERGFFLVFADQTSAEETYGAGRFLSVGKPNEKDEVIIDFNKAYNPPCAFTAYATCPLPPKENILDLRVTAGEKTGQHIGHH